MRSVTAADANRYFSKLLREVKAGETIVVTSHGEPVARIMPLTEDERCEAKRIEEERQVAWEAFLAHLGSQPTMNTPITWTRDDLYDDDF